jgi:hypothetical protein
MARERDMAKIGIGRDAADIAFLIAFGTAVMDSQSVCVEPAGAEVVTFDEPATIGLRP